MDSDLREAIARLVRITDRRQIQLEIQIHADGYREPGGSRFGRKPYAEVQIDDAPPVQVPGYAG